MKKSFALIRIIRPLNFLITFSSIFVAGIICSTQSLNLRLIILAAFSGSLVGSGGNVINDIVDVKIDKINRPDRPLPSGEVSEAEAFLFYILLNAAAIALTFSLNTLSTIIVLLSIIIVFLYSYQLKKIPLAGNLSVAFMTGLAFIYGGVAVGNAGAAVIPSIFAFLINLIREIIKDIEDLEGDIKNAVFSYPAKYGIDAAFRIITILTSLLLLFTLVPFIFKLYRIEYFIIVMLTVNTGLVYFLSKLAGNHSKAEVSKESFLLKVYMIFGLIAIYFGN